MERVLQGTVKTSWMNHVVKTKRPKYNTILVGVAILWRQLYPKHCRKLSGARRSTSSLSPWQAWERSPRGGIQARMICILYIHVYMWKHFTWRAILLHIGDTISHRAEQIGDRPELMAEDPAQTLLPPQIRRLTQTFARWTVLHVVHFCKPHKILPKSCSLRMDNCHWKPFFPVVLNWLYFNAMLVKCTLPASQILCAQKPRAQLP